MTRHDPDGSNPFSESLDALERAYELAAVYVGGLADRPVARAVKAEELADALGGPLPERRGDPASAISEWMERADPGIVASSGPRFFGYVNGGTTPAALAGDWLASSIDQNAGPWPSSPAAAETEHVAIRWLKELFGLPLDWAGTLTTGATHANLVGLAAARQWAGTQLGFDAAADGLGFAPIPIISSTEIHASARKALSTLGLGRNAVRTVPAADGSVDLAALERELGGIDGPVIVIVNAGEVNTGAFDRIDEVARRCRSHSGGAWLHVDGAFGLFAALSPRTAYLVSGVDMADSVAVDGHKWLNVPYDSGFTFVRDERWLAEAFAIGASYVAPGGGRDLMSYLPEMSRRFRGLAVWCALKAYGREGYREVVERCVDNAAAFANWLEAGPGMELMAPVPLNIVCFRYAPEGFGDEAADEFNRRAIAALQADGRVFVTGTGWKGRASIRAAFDNWATGPRDVEILQEAVVDIGRQLTG